MIIDRKFHGCFFHQKMKLLNKDYKKFDFLLNIIKNTTVLHIGCCDYPIFKIDNNLHGFLYNKCNQLDGMDTNAEELNNMKRIYPNSMFFNTVLDIKNYYEYIIIPDVLEHVDNIRFFLDKLTMINFKTSIITVPNIMGHWLDGFFSYSDIDGVFKNELEYSDDYIEIVHPDHKVCFSPYTFYNVVELYTNWKIREIGMVDKKHTLYIIADKI